MKVFLLRHASPDRNYTDIPYDVPPGPPLSAKGEKEAAALAVFLKTQGVVKLYYSPFERTAKTAQIVAAANNIPYVEEKKLAEWRREHETEVNVRARMKSTFDHAFRECAEIGSIGLVSHGGPIDVLLQELGINKDELAIYKTKFDTTNPLPPAGAWEVERNENNHSWNLHLKFIPPTT